MDDLERGSAMAQLQRLRTIEEQADSIASSAMVILETELLQRTVRVTRDRARSVRSRVRPEGDCGQRPD
jgi:hypothetical protein